MEGSKELIQELSQSSEKINQDIEKLQKEIDALDEKIEEYGNDFSVETVNKKKDALSQKELYQNALEEAKAHRQQLLTNSTDDTIKRAGRIIDGYRNKVNEEAQTDSEKVKDHIKEIQQIYSDLKQRDKEARQEVERFIKEVKPYLDATPSKEVIFGGQPTPKSHILEKKIGVPDRKTFFTMIKGFDEYHHGISGLFPPKQYMK